MMEESLIMCIAAYEATLFAIVWKEISFANIVPAHSDTNEYRTLISRKFAGYGKGMVLIWQNIEKQCVCIILLLEYARKAEMQDMDSIVRNVINIIQGPEYGTSIRRNNS